MVSFPGYSIMDQLHEGANTLIYRARRDHDNLPVVLKVLKKEYPLPEEISKFKWEYTMISGMEMDGIIGAHGLEKHQNVQAIVLEDFGGTALSRLLPDLSGDLEPFFTIACGMAEILSYTHQQEIIHKDVNPSNIIWNRDTGQIKLIDFGISTVLPREALPDISPGSLEGTLAYISPEQTGRMNRGLDYRADLYSLGVTLYEMLTGRLPFEGKDTLELIHCHIAKPPLSPHRINPDIPDVLSAIVLKLLAKTAEERYQSAHGLKHDLERCRRAWETHREIPSFSIGRHDLFYQLRIPQRLYGRDKEVEDLIHSFDLAAAGTSEMLLITGHSGIGKSELVNEIKNPITRRRGFFTAGKFDQYQRSIPFSAVTNALRELIKQCLTQSDDQIAEWKEKILARVGSNGRILIDVIPELELITGKQPGVPELGATEAQNRFNMVFRNFISVFAQKDHPLVLFLDDLQWVDPASLGLIKTLITDPDSRYFLLIGAFRDHEVDDGHPLVIALDEIKKLRSVTQFTLAPLELTDINLMVCDAVFHDPQTCYPLAELVSAKTGGNPFFISEFLKNLFRKNLLFIDENGEWQWHESKIRKEQITENVVDLLAGQILELPRDTQEILKLSACIGNEVDVRVLTLISRQSRAQTVQALWASVKAGFLVSSTDLDRISDLAGIDAPAFEQIDLGWAGFRHDRIHQAAYSLISPEERTQLHLTIGWLLLENSSPADLELSIFDITGHLNKGLELIQDGAQRLKLAELNAAAGKKAKKDTAYTMAAAHFESVGSLLGDSGWQDHYGLMFDSLVSLAEVLYLSGDFDRAEELYQTLSDRAATPMDKVRVYTVQMVQYHLQGRLQDALDTQLAGLRLLGLEIPEGDDAQLADFLGAELGRVPELLGDRRFEDLVDAPEMSDEKAEAMMNILSVMWITVYVFGDKPNLMAWVCAKMTTLSLEHGNSELSSMAYVNYGLLVSAFLGDFDLGYRSGKMALGLSERYDNQVIQCQVYCIFYNLINHWKQPISKKIDQYGKAYDYGIQSGEFCYASYALIFHILHLFVTGSRPLGELLEEAEKFDRIIRKISPSSLVYSDPVMGHLLNLRGRTAENTSLDWEHFEEKSHIQIHSDNPLNMCWWYCAKLEVLYLYEHYEKALEMWEQAEQIASARPGQVVIPQIYFYTSLTLLRSYPAAEETDRERYMETVDRFLEKMKIWSNACEANHTHKALLVEAEKFRVLGRDNQASDFYDRAIQSAEDHGFVNNAALANECAARFWLEKGRTKFARLYMTEAWHRYRQWGATAKAYDLEAKYSDLLVRPMAKAPEKGRPHLTTISTITQEDAHLSLDFYSVLKAARAISQEIVLETLLEKLMAVVIESAGADKGLILLEMDRELKIAASGDIQGEAGVIDPVSFDTSDRLPVTLVKYVARTKESIVLDNAPDHDQFSGDNYFRASRSKSVLCAPILNKGELTGILYLENNQTTGAFTPDRLELLNILAAQTAVSIENAKLYQDLDRYNLTLEQRVSERTDKLHQALKKVEISNRKITDSISYARRIQKSLLPEEEEVRELSRDHFILWKPRDIVGGDIYAVEKVEGGFLVAVMDCTGHGVPGAFMSMIASSLLKRLVRSADPRDPGDILARLNRGVRSSLGRDRLQTIADDGLDASICFVDTKNRSLTFAGAGLPLIYISREKISRIRGDRQSLGYQSSDPDYTYTNHVLDLEKGMRFYLATDGFWDQLGGDKELRFGIQRFMDLLYPLRTKPMAGQDLILMKEFQAYRKQRIVQDDLTVIGFSIH